MPARPVERGQSPAALPLACRFRQPLDALEQLALPGFEVDLPPRPVAPISKALEFINGERAEDGLLVHMTFNEAAEAGFYGFMEMNARWTISSAASRAGARPTGPEASVPPVAGSLAPAVEGLRTTGCLQGKHACGSRGNWGRVGNTAGAIATSRGPTG
jgi:hypothetical protein